MKPSRLLRTVATSLGITACLAALAIALGGPPPLQPMKSINDPFLSVDFSDMPAISRFTARDGGILAYRHYPGISNPGRGSVVLVHGSSASSSSLHPMAKAFSKAGFDVYALDMRGHGASSPKGNIFYVGQLEDDIEDFIHATAPHEPRTLVGFSSGGGFVLRFAGSERQKIFDSYLLLSPYLHHTAPTFRPGSGGWVSVGIPRIAALSSLNRIGLKFFNDLPVIRFALNENAKEFLTSAYSFNLWADFAPHDDYQADIRAAKQPMALIVGQNDEVFHADKFAEVFSKVGNPLPVTIVPGVAHIPLTLDANALREEIAAVERMNSAASGHASRQQ